MNTVKLILKEIRGRKTSFIISVLAILLPVASVVAFGTISQLTFKEIKKTMLKLKNNMVVLPADISLLSYYNGDLGNATLDEQLVHEIAATKGVPMNHLIATLEKKTEVNGMEITIQGVLPAVMSIQKSNEMGLRIPEGKCYAGRLAAERLHLEPGKPVTVKGRRFIVDKILEEEGNWNDFKIFLHLHDAQKIFNMPGKINSIMAVNCLCHGMLPTHIKQKIQQSFPGIKVVLLRSLFDVRKKARKTISDFGNIFLSVIMTLSMITVIALLYGNAHTRKSEVAMLTAIGFSPARTGMLFAARSLLTGILGGILGCVCGHWIALWKGPQIVSIRINPARDILQWAFIGAVALSLVISLIPIIYASSLNPGQTLKEE